MIMGCCDTGLKKPNNDSENGDDDGGGQDDTEGGDYSKKPKNISTWIIVIVLIAGLAVMWI